MDRDTDRQRYIDRAIEMGDTHAVGITPYDVAFDPHPLLKCMCGCTNWRTDTTHRTARDTPRHGGSSTHSRLNEQSVTRHTL